MSVIRSIGKIIAVITFFTAMYAGFVYVFLPNLPVIEVVMTDFTESVFGIEPSPGWDVNHENHPEVKTGVFIQPYILGVKTPLKWVSSPDSLHPEVKADLKLYEASF